MIRALRLFHPFAIPLKPLHYVAKILQFQSFHLNLEEERLDEEIIRIYRASIKIGSQK
jgi:hypothetical protein